MASREHDPYFHLLNPVGPPLDTWVQLKQTNDLLVSQRAIIFHVRIWLANPWIGWISILGLWKNSLTLVNGRVGGKQIVGSINLPESAAQILLDAGHEGKLL